MSCRYPGRNDKGKVDRRLCLAQGSFDQKGKMNPRVEQNQGWDLFFGKNGELTPELAARFPMNDHHKSMFAKISKSKGNNLHCTYLASVFN